MTVATGHRLSAFFHLAAYTRARRGELLNLRWRDVDLEKAEIIFRGSTDVIDGERVAGTTKGGRSRVVSIDPETVKVLKKHKERQDAEKDTAGDSWVGQGHVFVTELGAQLYPDTPSALIADLVKAYNNPKEEKDKPKNPLPRARLHDLRHLHATTLLLAGVPVHVVARRLGHTDPAGTLRVYAHVLREQATEVADILAQSIEGPREAPTIDKTDISANRTLFEDELS